MMEQNNKDKDMIEDKVKTQRNKSAKKEKKQ